MLKFPFALKNSKVKHIGAFTNATLPLKYKYTYFSTFQTFHSYPFNPWDIAGYLYISNNKIFRITNFLWMKIALIEIYFEKESSFK